MNFRNHNKIFSGNSISETFQKLYSEIISAISRESEEYILNVNETAYVEHLESKYKLNAPKIHFDQVYADSYEKDIPAEYFPRSFYVNEGKSYKKDVFQFFIPCSGEISLLKNRPGSSYYMNGGGNFSIASNTIVSEFINFHNDAAEIKRQYDNEVSGVHGNYNILVKDIDNFNSSLKAHIQSELTKRKNSLLSKANLLSALGVPLRKKGNTTTTFAIPKPQLREKISVKPVVNEKGFKPEPSLDDNNYLKILKLINDVGKNFERMPSLYKDKGEEDLRDHILMTLDPNFEFGSASGETFNKSGKTDIQLRYDSSVVFIAECKFWSGEKNFLSTISQLLGYLTWRDNKASTIVFVRQKDFSSILKKVELETPNHPNYLGYVGKIEENWFNYRFHINGDKNRELKLAIQLYHLPPLD